MRKSKVVPKVVKEWLKRDPVKAKRELELDSVGTEKREGELLDLLTPFLGCEAPFSRTASDRCLEKGLVPAHLVSCLRVLHFLSFAVLSAQKAQRKYGVRASVLLSMALDEFSFDIRYLARDPMIFRERDGKRTLSPNIDRWFLARAKTLATAKALRNALPSASPRRYIYRLCELGYCDSMKARDLTDNIDYYCLADCDLAGMLATGEYVRWEFEKVTDGDGNLIAVEPVFYRDWLRKIKAA